jgi:diadenosine tetraphosphate (Ap4A) HIT family hydrolase
VNKPGIEANMAGNKTRDFLGNEWEFDCMGCAIGDGSLLVPGDLIQQTDYFCVHQDPLIPLPGFLVIASIRHIRSISEMGQAEYDDLARLIRSTHQAIKQVTEIEYLTLVQEENSPHFHLWFFPWTQSVIETHGQPSLSRIRDIMAGLRKQPLGQEEWPLLAKTIKAIQSEMAG